MRPPMILIACVAILYACSADTATDTGITDTTHVTNTYSRFFASADGSASGDGSVNQPWDLATALAQPSLVKPGDTIWLRGGTYKGNFVSTLTGTSGAPIVLRQAIGERATIDGRLDINGQYAYYWGFEVLDSDPLRTTTTAGSHPPDLPRNMIEIFVTGAFNKLINLVAHDEANGVFSGSPAEGTEIYGSVFYNNGWIGPDRGHGHNIYLQNDGAMKDIADNVLFDSFDAGLHMYGSDVASIINFQIEGNSIFSSGGPALSTYGYQRNVEVSGGYQIGNITFDKNSVFHIDANLPGLLLGTEGSAAAGFPLTLTNNIIQGSSEFNIWTSMKVRGNKFTSGPTPYNANGQRLVLVRIPTGVQRGAYDWDANSVAYLPSSAVAAYYKREDSVGVNYTTLPAWQQGTGWDASGSFTSGEFSGIDIVVRPNRYEAGRANITVWNWINAASVNIDASSILKAGDAYVVHHVYDLFGAPVASGTYSGQPISIPLRSYTPPIPIGMTSPPESTGTEFNVFIIQKA